MSAGLGLLPPFPNQEPRGGTADDRRQRLSHSLRHRRRRRHAEGPGRWPGAARRPRPNRPRRRRARRSAVPPRRPRRHRPLRRDRPRRRRPAHARRRHRGLRGHPVAPRAPAGGSAQGARPLERRADAGHEPRLRRERADARLRVATPVSLPTAGPPCGPAVVGVKSTQVARVRRGLAESGRAFSATARNPSLLRAQLAFGASWTAEWAFMVALGVIAFRDGGATAVGVVAFARMAPSFVLTPLGTTLADHFPRDRVLVWSSLIR